MRLATRYAAALAVLALCGRVHADASVGGAFRHPGYGARVWGMGGAGSALVDDESAVSWNPAMMALLDGDAIGLSYVNLVKGTTAQQSQFAYAHVLSMNDPDGDLSTVRHAVGVLYTNINLGVNEGNDYNENLLRVSYAFTPDHFVTMGASIEGFYSSSSVDNFGAKGSTVDAAVRLNLTQNVTVAIVARDIFSRYSYDDGRDFKKNRAFTLAAAYTGLEHVSFEGDAWTNYGDFSRLILGAETDYLLRHIALRAGVASLRSGEVRTVPYFGFGVRLLDEHINIHYNANLDDANAFEDTHRFTLSILL